MKAIVIVILILNSYCVFGQMKNSWSQSHYDFRVVKKDSIIRLPIVMFNVGQNPIELGKIYTSCHCVQVKSTKSKISPGDSCTFCAQITANRIGLIREEIIICFKGYCKPKRIKIKGKVTL